MRSPKDPRHVARIMSVMDLYYHFFPEEIESSDLDFDQFELGNYVKPLREKLTEGTQSNYKDIDEIIDKYSQPVKTTDLDSLVLQIIRLGIYEGFIAKSVPPKVAVDEAIELTRDFGQELAARKVGGILGKVFDNLAAEKEKIKEENK